MYLNPGETLGPFRIQGQLGAGGMGTVYKALDTRLNRTVAIKVLTGLPSLGEELRRRFEREAQAIAALNHPHICVVHDVGEEGGIPYIVMEYLEGETLASRLLKGPLRFEQVLQYAAQIADALDTAHRVGVVHRDLKPANIVLTKGGAKLLDFGIAKLLSDAPEDSLDATTRLNLTQRGTIVGTLQYMAPEQVQGTAVDSRTDIFSFGAVVYEMATGRKAFAGASQTELTVAILEHHPPAMSSVQPATPAALERVVSICLAKAPEHRWQSARDVALLLREVVGAPVLAASSPHSRHARRWAVWSMALVTTLALIAAGLAFTRVGARGTSTIAFTIPAPAQASPRMQLDPFTTISPDGRHVAFTLRNPAGGGDLWLRSLDSFEARVLPGTEGAFIPFWSADSTEIAFFTTTDQQLKAVAHTGGTVRVLCAADYPLGGTWSRDGTILFSAATVSADRSGTATSGVHRVSQAGGVAAPVVVSGRAAPERGLLRRYGAKESWPQFLPDGRHFIYLDRDTNTIRLRTLGSDQSAALLTADSQAVYAAPGHLLFVRQGSLMAQPFDAAGLKLSGEPFRVLENVRFDTSLGGAVFSASANGTLAYSAGLIQGPSRAVWVNHAGQPGERMELATVSLSNRLSPDGRQLVQDRVTPGEVADLWVVDLMLRRSVRLTSSVTDEEEPIWSPDGAHVAYASNPGGVYDIYRRAASGSGREEILFTSRQDKRPSDWSRDGRFIAFSVVAPQTNEDIWLLDLQGGRVAVPVANTTAQERNARFSPSGKLIAYRSDQTGRAEIYIQKIPTGTAAPASTDGGFEPFWRQDGKELYFRSPDNWLMGVAVELDARSAAGLRVDGPRRLFELPHHCGLDRCVDVEVTAAGGFFVVTADAAAAQAPMHVIVNWASVTNRGRATP